MNPLVAFLLVSAEQEGTAKHAIIDSEHMDDKKVDDGDERDDQAILNHRGPFFALRTEVNARAERPQPTHVTDVRQS